LNSWQCKALFSFWQDEFLLIVCLNMLQYYVAVLWRKILPLLILSRSNFGNEYKYIIDIVLMNSNILRTNLLETAYAS